MSFNLVSASDQGLYYDEEDIFADNIEPIVMSAWFRMSTVAQTGIIQACDKDFSSQFMSLAVDGSGYPEIRVRRGTNNQYSHPTLASANKWHHILGVFDWDNLEVTLYFNGVKSGPTGITVNGPLFVNVNRIAVGYYGDSSPSEYHNGLLADVFITRGLIPPDEAVNAIYRGCHPSLWHPTKQLALWRGNVENTLLNDSNPTLRALTALNGPIAFDDLGPPVFDLSPTLVDATSQPPGSPPPPPTPNPGPELDPGPTTDAYIGLDGAWNPGTGVSFKGDGLDFDTVTNVTPVIDMGLAGTYANGFLAMSNPTFLQDAPGFTALIHLDVVDIADLRSSQGYLSCGSYSGSGDDDAMSIVFRKNGSRLIFIIYVIGQGRRDCSTIALPDSLFEGRHVYAISWGNNQSPYIMIDGLNVTANADLPVEGNFNLRSTTAPFRIGRASKDGSSGGIEANILDIQVILGYRSPEFLTTISNAYLQPETFFGIGAPENREQSNLVAMPDVTDVLTDEEVDIDVVNNDIGSTNISNVVMAVGADAASVVGGKVRFAADSIEGLSQFRYRLNSGARFSVTRSEVNKSAQVSQDDDYFYKIQNRNNITESIIRRWDLQTGSKESASEGDIIWLDGGDQPVDESQIGGTIPCHVVSWGLVLNPISKFNVPISGGKTFPNCISCFAFTFTKNASGPGGAQPVLALNKTLINFEANTVCTGDILRLRQDGWVSNNASGFNSGPQFFLYMNTVRIIGGSYVSGTVSQPDNGHHDTLQIINGRGIMRINKLDLDHRGGQGFFQGRMAETTGYPRNEYWEFRKCAFNQQSPPSQWVNDIGHDLNTTPSISQVYEGKDTNEIYDFDTGQYVGRQWIDCEFKSLLTNFSNQKRHFRPGDALSSKNSQGVITFDESKGGNNQYARDWGTLRILNPNQSFTTGLRLDAGQYGLTQRALSKAHLVELLRG